MRLPGQCLLWVHPADEVEPVVGRPGSMSFWIPTGLRKGGPQAGWKSALGVHHFSLQGLCLGLHLSKIPLSGSPWTRQRPRWLLLPISSQKAWDAVLSPGRYWQGSSLPSHYPPHQASTEVAAMRTGRRDPRCTWAVGDCKLERKGAHIFRTYVQTGRHSCSWVTAQYGASG